MLIFLRAIAEKALEYLFLTNLILSRVAGMGSFFFPADKRIKKAGKPGESMFIQKEQVY